jgi:hypothetical protein
VARAVRAGRQIQEVVDALEAAGIESALLKGPALARTVYPDPALRQSVDIDIIVRPEDVLAAETVLEGLGYRCPIKGFRFSQHQYNHDTFEPPVRGERIELHWTLDYIFDLFPQDWVDQAIARRVRVESDDLSFHSLGTVDHLLHLAFHDVFQHRLLRLHWVVDAAGLMRALPGPHDWTRTLEQSVGHHVRIPLGLLVNAASLWNGAAVPGDGAGPLAWPAPSEREHLLWRHGQARHTSLSSSFFIALQGKPGLVEKARYGYRFVLPPAPMLHRFRRSASRVDIPLAHLRRWASIVRYI